MEQRFGKEFFQLQEEIFKKKHEYNSQFDEIKKIKTDLMETKKNIAEVLNSLATKTKWLCIYLMFNISSRPNKTSNPTQI